MVIGRYKRIGRLQTNIVSSLIERPASGGTVANIRCVEYPTVTANNTYSKIMGIAVETYGSITIFDPNINTTDDMHEAAQGMIVYYEVATPTTETFAEPIDLTYAVQAGGNEAWIVPEDTQSAAVTGEIGYPLSTDSIRNMPLACIAPIEGAVASANYSVGSYLIKDGQLWKVTTAIASGETIPASSLAARTVFQMVQEMTA